MVEKPVDNYRKTGKKGKIHRNVDKENQKSTKENLRKIKGFQGMIVRSGRSFHNFSTKCGKVKRSKKELVKKLFRGNFG